MNNCDLVISRRGADLYEPGGLTPLATATNPDELLAAVTEFCAARKIAAAELCLYLAEELLFSTRFALPAKTPKMEEAVGYQLGMLVPFPEGSFYSRFTAARSGDQQQIVLYAGQQHLVLPTLEALAKAGHSLSGLFPEHQRYVTRLAPKTSWSLLLEGKPATLFVFRKTRLVDRVLCRDIPSNETLAELGGTTTLYHGSEPPARGLLSPAALLAQRPLHKAFNLLPDSFRRPDYFKAIIASLLAANLVLLLLLGGYRLFQAVRLSRTVDKEIAAIMPRVKAANELMGRQEKLTGDIARFAELGSNPDLVGFLKKLTDRLPPGSYLDQLRLDKRNGSYAIQGYAEDIGSLTTALQDLGEIKLKSTSRRQNQTYFQMEIATP